ncbi:hypothetical protein [Enterococcus sp.]|uniref:hypothetical protein n=1 Tax=Enterococcus sp. TaxID=35783 RepID=UPI002FCB30AA
MTEKQFEEKLKNLRFGIARDFEDVDAITVTRGVENVADIYADGRMTTCFRGFKNLEQKEKVELTNLINVYVSSLVQVSA